VKHMPPWVPGFDVIRKSREWRKDLDELAEAPFEMVKADIVRG
jgi:hypothetical protein